MFFILFHTTRRLLHRTHSPNAFTKVQRLATDCHDTNTTDRKIINPLSNCFPAPDLREDLLYIQHKSGAEQFRSRKQNKQILQSSYFPVHLQQKLSSTNIYPHQVPREQAPPLLRNSPLVALAWPFYPEYSTS